MIKNNLDIFHSLVYANSCKSKRCLKGRCFFGNNDSRGRIACHGRADYPEYV